MESIAVSKFKATCLAVLQRVKRTGRPVIITRFGQPIAEVVRPQSRVSRSEWLGSMAGRIVILGDVVGPAVEPHVWLWTLAEPGKLSKRVRAALTRTQNELWISSIRV